MKKILGIIFLLIIIFLIGFQLSKKQKEKKEIIELEKEIPVEIEYAKENVIKEEIENIGEIEPNQKVIVYSEATGIVEEINVKEGDYVKKGYLIAQIDYKKRKLDYENIENQIKALERNLENVKRDYERFSNLYKEGVISEKKLNDIKTTYDVLIHQLEGLKKQFELAKIRIEDAFIYSPIDGFIGEKFIDKGELITESSMMKNSPIVSIIDIDKVKVKIPIPQQDIGKVKNGQIVYVKIDAYPEKEFKGKGLRIYPQADPKTRTVNVEVIIENHSHLIKPGMFCKAKIIVGEKKAVIIPLDALMKLPISGRYYCFVVKNGKVEKKYLKIGKIGENYAEVTDGISKGEIVVVSSQGILDTGKKVKIIEKEKNESS